MRNFLRNVEARRLAEREASLAEAGRTLGLAEAPVPTTGRVTRSKVLQRRAQIARLRAEGLTLPQVARRMGIDVKTVQYALRKFSPQGEKS